MSSCSRKRETTRSSAASRKRDTARDILIITPKGLCTSEDLASLDWRCRAYPEETTQSSDLNFPVWKIGSSSPQEDKSNAGAFLVSPLIPGMPRVVGLVSLVSPLPSLIFLLVHRLLGSRMGLLPASVRPISYRSTIHHAVSSAASGTLDSLFELNGNRDFFFFFLSSFFRRQLLVERHSGPTDAPKTARPNLVLFPGPASPMN